MNPTNAKLMLVDSDYPLDKVVWMYTFSVPITGFGFNDVTVNHGLGFTPLVQGAWTQDSSWATVYDENSGPVIASSGMFVVNTAIETTSTTVKIFNTNNQAAATTVYWRLYGFMPSDVDVDAALTSSLADNFILNTDYNYTKLYLSGVTTSSSSSTVTVNHNLGYKPEVLAWSDDGTKTIWMNSWAQEGNNGTCQVTDATLVFTKSPGAGSVRYHYRIYLDE